MSAKLSISFYIDLNTFIKKNAHSCAEHLHAMCDFCFYPTRPHIISPVRFIIVSPIAYGIVVLIIVMFETPVPAVVMNTVSA